MLNYKKNLIIPVSNKKVLTSFVFYEYLLPTISKTLKLHRDSIISFDFTGLNSINPLVVPNLIILGMSLKNYFKYPVEIYLDPVNNQSTFFLERLNFFNICLGNNIFIIDDRFIGGYNKSFDTSSGLSIYINKTYNSANELIECEFFKKKYFLNFINQFDEKFKMIFATALGELAFNSLIHGISEVVITTYGGPKVGLNCAVSDGGIGITQSLLKSKNNLRVYNENDLSSFNKYRDFNGIIEAIFRRFRKKTYGLFSVINEISNLNGTSRIHTGYCQVIFTKNSISSIPEQTEDVQEIAKSYASNILEREKKSPSPQTSPVRFRNSTMAGTHIEFEIPTN